MAPTVELELRCPTCRTLLARRNDKGVMEQRRPGRTAVRVEAGEFECLSCGVVITFSGHSVVRALDFSDDIPDNRAR